MTLLPCSKRRLASRSSEWSSSLPFLLPQMLRGAASRRALECVQHTLGTTLYHLHFFHTQAAWVVVPSAGHHEALRVEDGREVSLTHWEKGQDRMF